MQYKISFSAGEFETDIKSYLLESEGNMAAFKSAILSGNPILEMAKVELKVEPVLKTFVITYTNRMEMRRTLLAQNQGDALSQFFKEVANNPGEYHVEAVKEVK